MQFAAFADESRYSEGRFRCIAAVSLPADAVVPLSRRLEDVVRNAELTELKWSELGRRGKRTKKLACASEFIDILVEQASAADLRADVLVWDTEDGRHAVANRDDIKNYERMYFHLHRSLMRRRDAGARWHLRPDEQVAIDWGRIEACLQSNGAWRRDASHPLLSQEFTDLKPRVATMRQVSSEKTPLCQLADLLAGMAPWTRDRRHVIEELLAQEAGQEPLFGEAGSDAPSRRDRDRFPLVRKLQQLSAKHRLGISLQSCGYLRTRDPSRPINFWHYEPQHPLDKAPRRHA